MQHDWSPGDEPSQHPLWDEQMALEVDMVQRGADKYRDRITKARDREEMTRVGPFQGLLHDLVAKVGVGVDTWVKAGNKSRNKHIAWYKLKELDPYVVAFIAVRAVLDSVTIGRMQLLRTAREIGAGLEHEARMCSWIADEDRLCKEDPDHVHGYKACQAQLHKQHATADHRERVNIHRFNSLVRENIDWADWTSDERKHVGFAMVDIMIRSTDGAIDIVKDSSVATTKKGIPYMVVLGAEIEETMAERLDMDAYRMPLYLPTLMPPKRWEGVKRGGYYTRLVRVPRLIRFKADNEEVQGRALEEYEGIDMPRVYSALHYVQEVPWRINTKVHAVAWKMWEMDLGIAGLSKRDPVELPPKPHDIDTNEEAAVAWKREARDVYGHNARRLSHVMSACTTLAIADQFEGKEFYFPHMLDFRGRMYPIPIYLQPQGNDLARGLLTFAKGSEITEKNGAQSWLAVHLANVWGEDKIAYEARIDFVWAHEEMWRRIAADPLHNREWCDKDDAWQSLAAIFEWVRFLDEGFGMVSSLPIRLDGTCNGLQHLSAMMLDEEGGASVNLLPSELPRDIYKEVAKVLQAKLLAIEAAGGPEAVWAHMWLEGMGREFPRSFTKTPVMVLPYGGTREAYFGAVYEWLRKNDRGGTVMAKAHRKIAVPWVVKHMWDAAASVLGKAMECMKWLQACAKVVAVAGQPIVWTTPSGFVVRHFYGTKKERQIKTKVDGRMLKLVVLDRTSKLSVQEQLQGIAPNFVHSQDGSTLMETVIRFSLENTIPPITTIHDAFGTTAGSMWRLFDRLREAFVAVHKKDALAEFRRACVAMMRDHYLAVTEGVNWYQARDLAEAAIPPLPIRGNLDLEQVVASDYFFA